MMWKKLLKRYPALKTAWREIFYRPGWYNDEFDRLERLFKWSEDPWNFLNSRYEQERLRTLVDHVKKYPHESVLEVGCGEGIMTAELTRIARHVVGIDVSPTALSRARERCPSATFVITSLNDFSMDSRFDIVICSETLYYVKDVKSAIDKLSGLGRFCLVSYLHRESRNLDSYMRQLPLIDYYTFEQSTWFRKRSMSIAVWENSSVKT